MKNRWVPVTTIGYEHTFTNTLTNFLRGLETGQPASLTFRDALSMWKPAGKPFTVEAVVKGCPAERAGIRSGDMIIAIEGKETISMLPESFAEISHGKKVTLRVRRPGPDNPRDVIVSAN